MNNVKITDSSTKVHIYLLLLHFEEMMKILEIKYRFIRCFVKSKTRQIHGSLNIPKSLKLIQNCLSGFAK